MIGVIILNYNNQEDTINCIKSIEQYNTAEIKIVVIDNGSCDESVDTLNSYFTEKYNMKYTLYIDIGSESILPYITLVETGENLGYARGNNVGLQILEKDSSVDKILILNNDILFVQDIIPKLSLFIDSNKNVALVSPLLLKRDGISIDYNCARNNIPNRYIALKYALFHRNILGYPDKYIKGQYMILSNPELLEQNCFPVELPSGSCMLIDKELFKQIGYFDSKTFLYYEENILFKRIQKIRKVNYILPDLKCIHLGAATTNKVHRSYKQRMMTNRSAFYYVMTYGDLSMFKRMIIRTAYQWSCFNIWIRHKFNKI